MSYERPISGLVVSVVDPQPGETIVDCCAAPGGKTLFMASRLSGEGKKMEWTEEFNFLMML
jgi:16S rRNA C967 or C1407 C5-methylase (RsmB/RsmF family)